MCMLKQMLVCLLVSLISTAESCSSSHKPNKTGKTFVPNPDTTNVKMQEKRKDDTEKPLKSENGESENKEPFNAKESTYTTPVSDNRIQGDMVSNGEATKGTEFNNTDRPDKNTKEIDNNGNDHASGANRGSPKNSHHSLSFRRANTAPNGITTSKEGLQFTRAQSEGNLNSDSIDYDCNFEGTDNQSEYRGQNGSSPRTRKKGNVFKRAWEQTKKLF
ncbi:hypothetical protein [Cardinium endosymbiont of Culicoides punctatus]|uniref:hypothetical protein n=1 Tax=Cardinium endosymbiont of Culicoides punctatus TaxID=2304601 RepID=UPI001058A67E|nr:hypothetical protein [Cardinium endosymbiont of Culicoides punctatus]